MNATSPKVLEVRLAPRGDLWLSSFSFDQGRKFICPVTDGNAKIVEASMSTISVLRQLRDAVTNSQLNPCQQTNKALAEAMIDASAHLDEIAPSVS